MGYFPDRASCIRLVCVLGLFLWYRFCWIVCLSFAGFLLGFVVGSVVWGIEVGFAAALALALTGTISGAFGSPLAPKLGLICISAFLIGIVFASAYGLTSGWMIGGGVGGVLVWGRGSSRRRLEAMVIGGTVGLVLGGIEVSLFAGVLFSSLLR